MSDSVPLYGFGGGGAALNFDVKQYATEAQLLAATPKENTTGVITTTAITNWYFAAEQPENMVNGDVWFPTGTSSPVAFNALKKNAVQVYPSSAKQMVGGALVDRPAKSYQGGKWVEWWNGYYFEEGKGSLIGEWTSARQKGINHNDNYVEISESSIKFVRDNTAYLNLLAQSPAVDLTDAKTLHFDYKFGVLAATFGVTDAIYQYADNVSWVASTDKVGTDRDTVSLDVSTLKGLYYITVYSSNVKTGSGELYNVWRSSGSV